MVQLKKKESYLYRNFSVSLKFLNYKHTKSPMPSLHSKPIKNRNSREETQGSVAVENSQVIPVWAWIEILKIWSPNQWR